MGKRLAIVSSYHEECGAAFYSSRLKLHLEAAGHSVTILRLPVSLLRISSPRPIRIKGDVEISRIAAELGEYDAALIQFEPGLYGTSRRTSYRRVRKLLAGAKKVVLTVHGFDRAADSGGVLRALDAVIDGDLRRAYAYMKFDNILDDMGRFWRYVGRSSHVKVLTFCRADESLLRLYYDLKRISNYPITYFSESQVKNIASRVDRADFLRQYGLDPEKKYFAVYGFLGSYKGHLTAIKALEYLPEDWHLAIVGGEHPQGLQPDRDIGSYVRQLLAFGLNQREGAAADAMAQAEGAITALQPVSMDRQHVKTDLFRYSEFKHFMPRRDLRDRVHFLGQVSDEAMPKFYHALDVAVHPYHKTLSGQSGSGPATMAVEFGVRALFSNAPVFREMERYFQGAMSFFNMGNFVELADALQRLPNFDEELAANRDAALRVYNPEGMVAAYMDMIDD